jgi:hypothetical protein
MAEAAPEAAVDRRSVYCCTERMRTLLIVSVVLGAILLVPSGAHLIELPHKLVMGRDAYFTVQQIYLGWSLFGLLIGVKILLDIVLGFRLRGEERAASRLAWSSAAVIALGLIVFFVWIQPANVATSNWSVAPSDWERLRDQWEFGHAAIASLTLLSVALMTSAAVRRLEGSRAERSSKTCAN